MMNRKREEILNKHRVTLVKKLAVNEILLSHLRSDNIVTAEMHEEIQSEKTSMRRAGALLDTLLRRGDDAFFKFIEALVETDQDDLALLLDKRRAGNCIEERNALRKPNPTPVVIGPSPYLPLPTFEKTDYLPIDPGEIYGEDSVAEMVFQVQPFTDFRLMNDMAYPMNHDCRGRALIINNHYFTKLPHRDGAQHDLTNLTNLFKQLSFNVDAQENQSKEQMEKLLEKERKREEHNEADMFVLFILSHGNNGVVYGIDGEELSIENEITAKFSPENCPALKGKPKVFFIQACQGEMESVYKVDSDGPASSVCEMDQEKMKGLETLDKPNFVPGYHSKSDIVMSYATVRGYVAMRNMIFGSWFVRCLVAVFSRRAHYEHLLDMLTEVNNLLTKLSGSRVNDNKRLGQLAEKSDTLTKKLYFFPASKKDQATS